MNDIYIIPLAYLSLILCRYAFIELKISHYVYLLVKIELKPLSYSLAHISTNSTTFKCNKLTHPVEQVCCLSLMGFLIGVAKPTNVCMIYEPPQQLARIAVLLYRNVSNFTCISFSSPFYCKDLHIILQQPTASLSLKSFVAAQQC